MYIAMGYITVILMTEQFDNICTGVQNRAWHTASDFHMFSHAHIDIHALVSLIIFYKKLDIPSSPKASYGCPGQFH